MAKVNFYLKNPKESKDFESSIYAVFHFKHYEIDSKGNKKFIRFKYPTDETIKIKFWNPKTQRAKETNSFTGYSEFNSRLDNLESDIKKVFRRIENDKQTPTPELLRTELQKERNPPPPPPKKLDLFSFIDNYINTVKQVYRNGQPVVISKLTIVKYKNFLTLLKRFATNKRKGKLDFDNINLDFYKDFIDYQQKEMRYSDNTIGKHIKTLKKFLNEATEEGLNTKLDYKSKRFTAPNEITDKVYLTNKELLSIYKLNLSNNKPFDRVRDLFLIACYTGLRYSDYSMINNESIYTNEKGEMLKINTHKTNTTVIIPLHTIVKEILNKYNYNLPKVITNQNMNAYLKGICKLANINENVNISNTVGGLRKTVGYPKYELITTHTGRRTAATNMFLAGIPIQSIMKITGHKTEKAFNSYLRFSEEDNANILFDSMFFKPQSNLKIG